MSYFSGQLASKPPERYLPRETEGEDVSGCDHSGKLTWQCKTTFSNRKYIYDGFSIAMLVCRSVVGVRTFLYTPVNNSCSTPSTFLARIGLKEKKGPLLPQRT